MAENTRASLVVPTANDHFKETSGSWFWGSLAVAAMVHFLIFFLGPDMRAENTFDAATELSAIDIPPEVDIPPPPEQIARPATPVVSDATIDEDITIASTTFEDNPMTIMPAPPTTQSTSGDISAAPQFTPFETAPTLQNRGDVERLLRSEYPAMLRDAGIGGSADVWFFINETGAVQEIQLKKSSGYDALDAAALKVAKQMRFSAAKNRDKPVPVWVSLEIEFTSR